MVGGRSRLASVTTALRMLAATIRELVELADPDIKGDEPATTVASFLGSTRLGEARYLLMEPPCLWPCLLPIRRPPHHTLVFVSGAPRDPRELPLVEVSRELARPKRHEESISTISSSNGEGVGPFARPTV